MHIDIEKLDRIVAEADSIVLSPEAEEVLVQFYEIKRQVEEAEQKIKEKIEQTALEQSPFFTKINGKHVTIRYQAYGTKYKVDSNNLQAIPENLYKIDTKYSPIAKEIDIYKLQNRALPSGIIENERKKVVSIAIKKADPSF